MWQAPEISWKGSQAGATVNIFVLASDPDEAASYHNDKHVVKMILESGQMMCSAHWTSWRSSLGIGTDVKRRDAISRLLAEVPAVSLPPWKMTHVGHPCTRWTQRSRENYLWHSRLGLALCAEYTRRYKKVHKAERVHEWLRENLPPTFEGEAGLTPFAVAMPDDCKVSDDPVVCYRTYYMTHKRKIASWKSETPPWWNPELS
jgi:hypothetical protein